MNSFGRLACVAIGIAFAVAAFALWAGFQHNPQGEFFDPLTGDVDYLYSGLVFGVWFAPTFLVAMVIGGGVLALFRAATWLSANLGIR